MQCNANLGGRSVAWSRAPGLAKHALVARPTLRTVQVQRVALSAATVEPETSHAPPEPSNEPAQLDFTNITRHNFKAALPHIRTAIHEATFVAIDAEFTGLHVESSGMEDLYDYEERYKRLLSSAGKFAICQFGLSAFKWHPSPGTPAGGYWEARTFNAYVFSRPEDAAGWDKRFLCQSSSLAYLASQGFDFNRLFHDGVAYMPLEVIGGRIRNLEELAENQQRSMETRSKAEDRFVADTCARVQTWLQGSEPELRLLLPNGKRMRTLFKQVVQQEFQLPSLGHDPFSLRIVALKGGGDDGDGSGGEGELESEEVLESDGEDGSSGGGEGANGGGSGQARQVEYEARLARLDRWRPVEMASTGVELSARQRIELFNEQAGFSQVFEALRDARQPVVGHNPTFDLAYMIAQFGGTLPRSWAQYKDQLQQTFPGGLYDTKYIAQQLAGQNGVPLGDTGLGNLHRALMDEQWLRSNVPGWGLRFGRSAAAAAVSSSEAAGGLRTAAQAASSAGTGAPEIRHALGHGGYKGVTDKAHEAGYDAFMTGCAFSRLLSIAEVKATFTNTTGSSGVSTSSSSSVEGSVGGDSSAPVSTSSPSSSSDADLLLQPLLPHRGRLNVPRSDLPYINVYGKDPVPNRPAVLHVSGFTPNTRWTFLMQRFQSVGLGPVQVLMQTAPGGAAVGALVQLSNPSLVPRALQVAREKWSSWTVLTYKDYYSSRGQQGREVRSPGQQQQGGTAAEGGSKQGGNSKVRAVPRLVASGKGGSDGQKSESERQGEGQAPKLTERQRLKSFTQVVSSRMREQAKAAGEKPLAAAAEEAPAAGVAPAAPAEPSVAKGTGALEDRPDPSSSMSAASAQAPSTSKAEAVAPEVVAERLRALGLAAERLVSVKPVGEAPRANGSEGLALRRPGRPSPKN